MSAQSPSATTAGFACHVRVEIVSVDSHSDDYNPTGHVHINALLDGAHQALKRGGGQRFRVYF